MKQLYDLYITLLDYKTWGEGFPSVLERLKYPNDKVQKLIENHREEERLELQKRNVRSVWRNNPQWRDLVDDDDDKYCEACHQSPCMCSDREATSSLYEF